MPISILMPALSPTMTEGNLAKWHKKPGDAVKAGQVIAEIETDKATMEVEAVDEGVIGKILVPEGTQAVKVNTPIAILLEDGEKEDDLKNFAAAGGTPDKANEQSKAPAGSGKSADTASPQTRPTPGTAGATQAAALPTGIDRIHASPLAKRIAQQKGVSLNGVRGSGPNGRIVKADVENYQGGGSFGGGASMPQGVDAVAQANALGQKYKAIPNGQIRKIVAKRLLESKQTVPHFYLTVDCRIDKLLDARAQINSTGDVKVSVNDLIIKAVAKSLAKVPAANASWSEDAILQYEAIDISVAVAGPNGLVTPIVKNADQKSIAAISAEMKDLATRARDNKLKPTEFQGGGFTISNLGMYGISHFAAIINPPQSCILAVGAGEKKPVVSSSPGGERIEIGTVMSVTLSVDHRSVDGAVGAEFLQAFKQFIENPVLLLV